MIFGKLLGALFGFSFLSWPGLLLGLWLGHKFDKGLGGDFSVGAGQRINVQQTFFRATFFVMGRLAKADGRVTQHEIQWAEAVMSHMRFDSEQRKQAIDFFNQGKDSGEQWREVLRSLRQNARWRFDLIQMFLEIQLQAAYADGQLDQPERELLQQVCAELGISAQHFEQMRARVEAERAFAGYQQSGQAKPTANQLDQAYQLLGVSKSASDAEVKRAYRKLMSQHHPDKLAAKGLPEEMMELAKEKTQEIQAAYEAIKKSRE